MNRKSIGGALDMNAYSALANKPVNAPVPIEYWLGDGPAVRAGLAALERLAILLDHAGLSDVAQERACNWIGEARAALERFG